MAGSDWHQPELIEESLHHFLAITAKYYVPPDVMQQEAHIANYEVPQNVHVRAYTHTHTHIRTRIYTH